MLKIYKKQFTIFLVLLALLIGSCFFQKPKNIQISAVENIQSKSTDDISLETNATIDSSSFPQAVYLNGASYLIADTNTPAFNVLNDFTIETYINVDTFTSSLLGVRGIFTSYPGISEPQSYNFTLNQVRSNGQYIWVVGFDIDRSIDSPNFDFSLGFSGSTEILPNRWYHVAVVHVDDLFTLYVDGKEDGSKKENPGDVLINNGNQFVVGGAWGSMEQTPHYIFRGAIDELRVSNIARYRTDFTPQTVPFIPDSNTIGLWHFDDALTDSSSYNYSLSPMGEVNYVAGIVHASSPTPNFGQAIKIDPLTNPVTGQEETYVAYPADNKLQMGENFTIEWWMKPDARIVSGNRSKNPNVIFGKEAIPTGSGDGKSPGYWAYIANGQLYVGIHTVDLLGEHYSDGMFSNSGVRADEWNFVKFVKKDNQISLYLNGNPEGNLSIPSGSIEQDNTLLTLGCLKAQDYPSCVSQYLGELDDFRISNIDRLGTDIPTGPLPADANTVALFRFDGDLTDTSGNNLNGQVFGNISYTYHTYVVSTVSSARSSTCPKDVPPHSKGNANCDDRIDLLDFAIWFSAMRNNDTVNNSADFNQDSKVSLMDFVIWLVGYRSTQQS